jgi:1-aminocyclopropane-1-carboxylate deaminase
VHHLMNHHLLHFDIACTKLRQSFYLCRTVTTTTHEALSGNKSWKLYHYYNDQSYGHVKRVVSYGGNQSNAMYAIHQLCKDKQWHFHYFSNPIDNDDVTVNSHYHKVFLEKKNSTIHDYEAEYKYYMDTVFDPADTLLIEQGACSEHAREGVERVAQQIHSFALNELNGEELNILLPSGTGTSCAYLTQYFVRQNANIRVWTVPCVGNKAYLLDQMLKLVPDSTFLEKNIHIIEAKGKYRKFAHPHVDLYNYWKQFKDEYGIELDLIYAPKTLVTFEDTKLSRDGIWMYLHTGGVTGNISQLNRYNK